MEGEEGMSHDFMFHLIGHSTNFVFGEDCRADERYDSGEVDWAPAHESCLKAMTPGELYRASEVAKKIGHTTERTRKALLMLRKRGDAQYEQGERLGGGFLRGEGMWTTVAGPATDPYHPRGLAADASALASCFGYNAAAAPQRAPRVVHHCADD